MPWQTNTAMQWINTEEQAIAETLKANAAKKWGDTSPYQAVRELRPQDLISAEATYTNTISPTAPTLADYHLTIAPTTTATISFSLTQRAAAFYGWYCDADLAPTGYLQVTIDNTVRQEVPAEAAYNATNDRIYLLDQVVFVPPGSAILLTIKNGSSSTATGVIWPLAWIAGTASALGVAPA